MTNNTLYTTPKMVLSSITADMIWQLFSQFIDPIFKDDEVGNMNAVNFMGIFYPFLITGIIYAGSRFDSYQDPRCIYTRKETGVSADDWENYKNASEASLREDKEIAVGVFLGMASWMAAYFLSQAVGLSRWEAIAPIGIGSAIPLALYSRWNDDRNNKRASHAMYAVLTMSFLLSGMAWYASYYVPSLLVKSGFPENHVVGGFVSICVTGLSSAATLGVVKLWETKGQNKSL